jgi:N-acetylneuraminic acid mutarotase
MHGQRSCRCLEPKHLGGRSSDNKSSSSAHSFDPAANSWSEVAPMLAARSAFSSFVLNGNVHVAGGWDRGRSLSSVERYDAVSDTWTEMSAMTQARYKISAHTMRLDMNLFDSLILKAERAQRRSVPPRIVDE